MVGSEPWSKPTYAVGNAIDGQHTPDAIFGSTSAEGRTWMQVRRKTWQLFLLSLMLCPSWVVICFVIYLD